MFPHRKNVDTKIFPVGLNLAGLAWVRLGLIRLGRVELGYVWLS